MTTAKERFEVGQVYGEYTTSVNAETHELDRYVSNAYEVVSRTAKYVTVKDVSPYGSRKGELKRFYVHTVNEEELIEHEYFAQRKSSNPMYQNRIHSYDLLEDFVASEAVADVEPEVEGSADVAVDVEGSTEATAEVEAEGVVEEEEICRYRSDDLIHTVAELAEIYHNFRGATPKGVTWPYEQNAPSMADVEAKLSVKYGAGLAKAMHFFADYMRSYHMMKQKLATLKEIASVLFKAEAIPANKNGIVDMLQGLKEDVSEMEDKMEILSKEALNVTSTTADVEVVADVLPEATPIKEAPTKTKVEKVVEAVNAAETGEAIEEALSECKKAELHEVLLAVCGADKRKAPNSWKREAIARCYARGIICFREREAFRALSFEEKYEYLTDATRSHGSMWNVLVVMTWDEVGKLCKRLGVDPNMDREYLPMELTRKLQYHVQANHIEALAADDECDGLDELIDHAYSATIKLLCKKHGIKLKGVVDDGSSRYNRELRKALYEYYV